MIHFVSDNHYNAHSGLSISRQLEKQFELKFTEDDFSCLENLEDCSLLILHMISATCNNELPSEKAEKALRSYLEKGGNLLLLHGSSAAFWQWDWWRPIVGHRWVRRNDPDGIEQSTHPVEPYCVSLCHARHPLMKVLQPMDLPKDEIYINLEQVCPTTDLMETSYEGRRYVQAWANPTPWGGEVIGLLPGHAPVVTESDCLIDNIAAMIRYLS